MLPILDNEQHKVNKNIFEKGLISSQQNFYKKKTKDLSSLLFSLNTVVLNFLSNFSFMFNVG